MCSLFAKPAAGLYVTLRSGTSLWPFSTESRHTSNNIVAYGRGLRERRILPLPALNAQDGLVHRYPLRYRFLCGYGFPATAIWCRFIDPEVLVVALTNAVEAVMS